MSINRTEHEFFTTEYEYQQPPQSALIS